MGEEREEGEKREKRGRLEREEGEKREREEGG